MSDDMSLHLDVTGDGSGAVSAATMSQEAMDRLTAAVGEVTSALGWNTAASEAATKAIGEIGSAATKSAAETSVAKGEINSLTAAVDTLTEHSYLLSRGMEAAGLSAEASATRIGAMGDALKGFIAANPEILAVVAALAALAASFEFAQLRGGIVNNININTQQQFSSSLVSETNTTNAIDRAIGLALAHQLGTLNSQRGQ